MSTDIVIMPLAFLLYLSAYLDRGNLGNAKVQGLVAAVLDGDDEKYSLVRIAPGPEAISKALLTLSRL